MSNKCYGLMPLQLNIYISPLDVLLLLVTLVILLPFFKNKMKHCIITGKHYTITTKASMQTHHNSLHSVLSRQWHNKHMHAVQCVQSTILCINLHLCTFTHAVADNVQLLTQSQERMFEKSLQSADHLSLMSISHKEGVHAALYACTFIASMHVEF